MFAFVYGLDPLNVSTCIVNLDGGKNEEVVANIGDVQLPKSSIAVQFGFIAGGNSFYEVLFAQNKTALNEYLVNMNLSNSLMAYKSIAILKQNISDATVFYNISDPNTNSSQCVIGVNQTSGVVYDSVVGNLRFVTANFGPTTTLRVGVD